MRKDLWERLDLPGEQLPGQVLVELLGLNRVLIENHQGVREYSRERITVSVRYGLVMVTGDCLELRCMSKERLVIIGRITGIELVRREKRNDP